MIHLLIFRKIFSQMIRGDFLKIYGRKKGNPPFAAKFQYGKFFLDRRNDAMMKKVLRLLLALIVLTGVLLEGCAGIGAAQESICVDRI